MVSASVRQESIECAVPIDMDPNGYAVTEYYEYYHRISVTVYHFTVSQHFPGQLSMLSPY